MPSAVMIATERERARGDTVLRSARANTLCIRQCQFSHFYVLVTIPVTELTGIAIGRGKVLHPRLAARARRWGREHSAHEDRRKRAQCAIVIWIDIHHEDPGLLLRRSHAPRGRAA